MIAFIQAEDDNTGEARDEDVFPCDWGFGDKPFDQRTDYRIGDQNHGERVREKSAIFVLLHTLTIVFLMTSEVLFHNCVELQTRCYICENERCMSKPFVYGTAVFGENFTDRPAAEMNRLTVVLYILSVQFRLMIDNKLEKLKKISSCLGISRNASSGNSDS